MPRTVASVANWARIPASERLDEPFPMAAFSSRTTSKPRCARRAAVIAPVTPPPMMATRSVVRAAPAGTVAAYRARAASSGTWRADADRRDRVVADDVVVEARVARPEGLTAPLEVEVLEHGDDRGALDADRRPLIVEAADAIHVGQLGLAHDAAPAAVVEVVAQQHARCDRSKQDRDLRGGGAGGAVVVGHGHRDRRRRRAESGQVAVHMLGCERGRWHWDGDLLDVAVAPVDRRG